MKTLVDTNIYVLALKHPIITTDSPDYQLSIKAKVVFRDTLNNDDVLISGQLVAEVYHVLTQRGKKMPPDKAYIYIQDILRRDNVTFKGITKKVYRKALKFSAKTKIHIWDFLVVLPFEGEIDRVLTMDSHFQDERLSQIAPVENPIGVWRTEG